MRCVLFNSSVFFEGNQAIEFLLCLSPFIEVIKLKAIGMPFIHFLEKKHLHFYKTHNHMLFIIIFSEQNYNKTRESDWGNLCFLPMILKVCDMTHFDFKSASYHALLFKKVRQPILPVPFKLFVNLLYDAHFLFAIDMILLFHISK